MRRGRSPGIRPLWVLAALLAAGPAPTTGMTVVLKPDCGGSGFKGTAQEGTAVIEFMSCPSGDDCHTRIGKPTGERMTEALLEGGNLRLWLGEFEVVRSKEELTEGQKSRLESLFSSPEADLARALPEVLQGMGICLGSPPMACLNLQMQGYEKARALPSP